MLEPRVHCHVCQRGRMLLCSLWMPRLGTMLAGASQVTAGRVEGRTRESC